MVRRSLGEIIEEIKQVLQKEGELSIRQISLKINSQWRTVLKALNLMKSLKIVVERKGTKTKRSVRLFKLK